MRGDGKPQAKVARNATWCDFLPAAKQQIPRNENAALRDDNSLAIFKLHHHAQCSRIGTFRDHPYNGASPRSTPASAMRLFKETALWDALKRLALGFGLIALFSSILLLSDVGHRTAASAASA